MPEDNAKLVKQIGAFDIYRREGEIPPELSTPRFFVKKGGKIVKEGRMAKCIRWAKMERFGCTHEENTRSL